MKAPRLTDTTLRDGSHPMRHRFTHDQIRHIVEALDQAGVPVIEVAHGNGLGGSSLQYGFSKESEIDLIAEARATAQRARIAVLLVPGIGTRQELQAAADQGAEIVRIATQCSEADISEQHFYLAKQMHLEAIGFLMMAHMLPPHLLVEQAKLMESYGADGICIVDSAGTMLPDDVQARVAALKAALTIPIGFHAHNNLGLAVGNTVTALEAGAEHIDGCLRGLGAGAGNAPTEVLAAVLKRSGCAAHLDLFRLMDIAEGVIVPMMPYQPIPDRDSLTSGYAGVHTTFLLHTKRASERFGVDARAILVELGRRRVVAGQEDMIVDVALELAQATPVNHQTSC